MTTANYQELLSVGWGARMPAQPRGVGANVATLRKARSLTQVGLARKANVSTSLLSKVEQGKVPASPAFIGAVARALRVDVPRITGQPYDEPGAGRSARLRAGIDDIRRAIATMDMPDSSTSPRPSHDLARDVQRLSDLGRQADYVHIGQALPVLLGELAAAIENAPEDEKPRLHSLLAEAYSGASAMANLLGYLDLRNHVLDRIEAASAVCDEPLRPHRVKWQRMTSFMAMGAYTPALITMEQTRTALGDDLARMDGPTMSVYGSTHLRSAVLAARSASTEGTGRARQAWDHIAEARRVADAMGTDRDDFGLAFGPSNVTQHEVSIAVEMEDGAQALRRARGARLSPSVPAIRRGHFYIDVARAYVLVGDRERALHSLQQARRIAPQQTRHHPMVRETALTIASSGRSTDELVVFLGWLGLN